MNRKEKIRQYKETPRPMGVYRITNADNGKVFIGSAVDVHARINRIMFQLQSGLYPDKEMQKDFSANSSAFSSEVIDLLEPDDKAEHDYDAELKLLEDMWLEKLRPYGEQGYNC